MSTSVLPFPAWESGRDLLEQPAVAVLVAERRVGEVRAPWRVEGEARRLLLLIDLADVHSAADQILPGGVDVLDGEEEPVKGPRLHRREALADLDRAL